MLAVGRGAEATTIDFQELGIVAGPGGITAPPSGQVATRGFLFGINPGLDVGLKGDQFLLANQVTTYPWNGTSIGINAYDALLSKVGGGSFSLQQFDFAGWAFSLVERPFTVTGTRADSTTTIQNFTPDGLSDGPGGAVDFQTFLLVGDWTNLVNVKWTHNVLAADPNSYFALDNIVLDATAVPEPASFLLLGTGLLAAVWYARRRRSVTSRKASSI